MTSGHGGWHAIAAAKAYGVQTMFTLSGAHIFPLFDAAVGGKAGVDAAGDPRAAERDGAIRLVDVRHEATAVFAAEATAKLTRTPGFAAVTAGPGVTNAVSGLTSAYFNSVPMVVMGGRSPDFRWGLGALQEMDHVPVVSSVTKSAATAHDATQIGAMTAAAFEAATTAHRGPAFLDVPMDIFYAPVDAPDPVRHTDPERAPDPDAVAAVAAMLAGAERPVLILGSDVWNDFAEDAAVRLAETLQLPVIPNGMGRGIVPSGHPLLVTRARSAALKSADVVVVVGTPLDFRLGYGKFGPADAPARVVHVVDHPDQVSRRAEPAAWVAGSLPQTLDAITAAWENHAQHRERADWLTGLQQAAAAAVTADAEVLGSTVDPIHPGRIYGELNQRLADDAVVIGDGGDFVSFAGKFIEPKRPGHWLDPGPYGCLGTGLGYAMASAIAKPSSQTVLLMGDGAAGFSLMDVDTLVRHDLPVVMVVGNNSAWGLEKHPMRLLHQYDVLADLQPSTRYDEVVRALGGAGETVTDPEQIGPALDRAFDAKVPYLVNVLTDPEIAYPRATTGL
ncbi:MAG: acetolactate synthase [Candidatus Nanopelagicales bacterium]|nr:acetolactate synthase [Candidatus Nanopelagicales bacterium]